MIFACESAKEAWTLLKNAHKGTSIVKISMLQMLASKFEDLRMLVDESINDFNLKLCEIANEAFILGEKYFEIKLMRKTLRSLPDRFAYKIVAIKKAKDVNTIRLDELKGSLQIFELNLKQKKKGKNIAFWVEKKDSVDQGKSSDDEALVLLTKNFNFFL